MQRLIPLSDGSAIDVTVAELQTLSGVKINGVGVTPDYAVEQDGEWASLPDQYDAQRVQAREVVVGMLRSAEVSTEETAAEATEETTAAPTEPPTEATTAATEPPTEATTAATEPPTEAMTAATEPPTEATTAATEPTTEEETEPETAEPEVNDMDAEELAARYKDGGGYEDEENDDEVRQLSSNRDAGTLSVYANGSRMTADAADIVAGIVQNEVGASFHEEAIKAQAVAAYSFVAQSNQTGTSPSVYLSPNVSSKVASAVDDVIGQAVYYRGNLAFTPYHATSAGQTTSSASVWGGSYPYLVSVDSGVDARASGYESSTRMTSDKVADLIESRLGIDVSGDPEDWIEIENYTDGDYVGNVTICGESRSAKTGSTLTGRLIRETVFNLRSACFEVDYDDRSDEFTFTTYGYGHGVGLSQNGAHLYALEGWDYVDILEHYYPGTEVA
jgi:SpoIID/LytB domain protein